MTFAEKMKGLAKKAGKSLVLAEGLEKRTSTLERKSSSVRKSTPSGGSCQERLVATTLTDSGLILLIVEAQKWPKRPRPYIPIVMGARIAFWQALCN